MFGVRIESMKENGSITKCTDMEKYSGQTAGNMKENTRMTKSMDKGLFIGKMAANMQEDGKMVSSMEGANTFCRQEKKKQGSGSKVKG